MPRYFLAPTKTSETQKIAKTLKKNNYHPNIIYLHNAHELEKLSTAVRAGDILEIHADGTPWYMGAQHSEKYDYSPKALALALKAILKDRALDIIIDLRFCNSGTRSVGPNGTVCYAESLSKFLAQVGCITPIIYGYTAYIHSQRPLKQSLVSEHDKHGAKVKHCRLEEGRVAYQNGVQIESPRKIMVEEFKHEADDFQVSEVLCQSEEEEKLQQIVDEKDSLEDILFEIENLNLSNPNERATRQFAPSYEQFVEDASASKNAESDTTLKSPDSKAVTGVLKYKL